MPSAVIRKYLTVNEYLTLSGVVYIEVKFNGSVSSVLSSTVSHSYSSLDNELAMNINGDRYVFTNIHGNTLMKNIYCKEAVGYKIDVFINIVTNPRGWFCPQYGNDHIWRLIISTDRYTLHKGEELNKLIESAAKKLPYIQISDKGIEIHDQTEAGVFMAMCILRKFHMHFSEALFRHFGGLRFHSQIDSFEVLCATLKTAPDKFANKFEVSQDMIDVILDRMNKDGGYKNLTEYEKEKLELFGQRL